MISVLPASQPPGWFLFAYVRQYTHYEKPVKHAKYHKTYNPMTKFYPSCQMAHKMVSFFCAKIMVYAGNVTIFVCFA